MSYDLQKMRNKVLSFVKRPLDDSSWIEVTNDTINEALRSLQQKIPNFNALETIDNTVVYPANTQTLDLKTLEGLDINKIISVQRLYKAGEYTGKPLLVMDYSTLKQNMLNFEQKTAPVTFENEEFNSYKSYISDTQGLVVYLLATDLGLYPVPSQDVLLAVHYTRYLPELVDNIDTNVLLENCPEYVFYYCLRQLNMLLSESSRISVSDSLLQEALSDARAWNSSLVYSNPLEL